MKTIDFFWWKLPLCFWKMIESLSYYETWLLIKYLLNDDEEFDDVIRNEIIDEWNEKAYMLRLFIKEINENKNDKE